MEASADKLRWELRRSAYPMTRAGYLTWRARQKSQAAAQVADLLRSADPPLGLDPAVVDRVAALVRKEGLGSGPGAGAGGDATAAAAGEAQVLEDVACLVFLDDQFDDFDRKADLDEDKMVGILRKTWGKMGEPGRQLALGMDLSERAKMLIGKALAA